MSTQIIFPTAKPPPIARLAIAKVTMDSVLYWETQYRRATNEKKFSAQNDTTRKSLYLFNILFGPTPAAAKKVLFKSFFFRFSRCSLLPFFAFDVCRHPRRSQKIMRLLIIFVANK
jgi:hypothetical protein